MSSVIDKAASYLGQNSRIFTKWRGVASSTAWCCIFVCYVLKQCGIEVAGYPTSCDKLDIALTKMGGKHITMKNAKAGDVVLFTWHGGGNNSGKGSRDHVGFIKSRNRDGSFETIEGNTSGSRVAQRRRSPRYIYKIIRLDAISAAVGWIKDGKGWWYRLPNGSYYISEWATITGKWYYFDASGYMVKGWQKIGDEWYYLSDSGAMVKGWNRLDGKWYYFDNDGRMKTGWIKTNDKWYYLSAQGDMLHDKLAYINGSIYAFDSTGAMKEGTFSVETNKQGALTL